MKRVILLSNQIDNPFDTSSTHFSYYDSFLNPSDLKYMQKSKNRTGEIVQLSPNRYYEECAKIFDSSVSNLMNQRSADDKLIKEYQQAMRRGDKFPLCFINYADETQEGLHRMMAAGNEFGWDTNFPVLAVTVYDQKEEDRRALNIEINDYMNYDLKKICDDAADNLSEEYSSPPDNLEDLFRSQVIELAESKGHSIDVDVEIKDHQGDLCLHCYLTSYDGHSLKYASDSARIWLADMFYELL